MGSINKEALLLIDMFYEILLAIWSLERLFLIWEVLSAHPWALSDMGAACANAGGQKLYSQIEVDTQVAKFPSAREGTQALGLTKRLSGDRNRILLDFPGTSAGLQGQVKEIYSLSPAGSTGKGICFRSQTARERQAFPPQESTGIRDLTALWTPSWPPVSTSVCMSAWLSSR